MLMIPASGRSIKGVYLYWEEEGKKYSMQNKCLWLGQSVF